MNSMKLKENHKEVKNIVLVETAWTWTDKDRDNTKLKEAFDLWTTVGWGNRLENLLSYKHWQFLMEKAWWHKG